jgi:Cdc6-like AAA superfamily ATPase
MNKKAIASKITLVDLSVQTKAGLTGLLMTESFLFSIPTSASINSYLKNQYEYNGNIYVLTAFLVSISILLLYAHYRGAPSYFIKILKSKRIDLLIMLIFGGVISILFDGLGMKYYKQLAVFLSPLQLLGLVFLPLIMAGLLVIRAFSSQLARKNKIVPSFFMNDSELQRSDDDLLNINGEAARFADRIWNGGSLDSIVFGIDAPWGIGKSSFINLCIEHLRKKQDSLDCIIYHFNPLRFQEKTNFLEKFINGLAQEIQKEIFYPEMHSLISNYSKLIRGKIGLSIFGIRFDANNNIDDAFDELELSIKKLNKKIIIIIDDLDRLNFSEIKEILFSIKKSFMLPNVSYLLSYDTENIVNLKKTPDDTDKVREFLEKFVNIKTSLFLDSGILSKYISDNFYNAVKNNLSIDPATVNQTKNAIAVIVEIYASSHYHHYQEFLGDIRKIKRLINTIISLEIEKTEFDNSDFDKHDLLHLLLIYLNYPHIFRKLFNTETNGKSGYFSLVRKHDDGYPKADPNGTEKKGWQNSTMYSDYISSLTTNQIFLLNKIFSAQTRIKDPDYGEKINEEKKASFACFNSNSGRSNLEQYLNLIAKLSKPPRQGQYKFYLNHRDKFKDGTSIDEIFKNNEFSFDKGEVSRKQFWHVIVNSAYEFEPDVANRAIDYLLQNLHHYSLLVINKIELGLRDDSAFYLIKLLDVAAWKDSSGGRTNNIGENVAPIAHRIFGENSYQGNGVIEQLMSSAKAPLGIFDVLIFRLYCCANRDNNFFNLQQSLSKHGSADAPTSGLVNAITIAEMREISQKIFGIFKDQFIVKKLNFHEMIDNLSIENITGRYYSYVTECIKKDAITSDEVNKAYRAAKTRIKSFTTYQLGNTLVESGVGCGYYDESGNSDGKGIASQFNDYLFDVCFTPSPTNNGFVFFIDYLMLSYSDLFSLDHDDGKQVPTIQSFTRILDRAKLEAYWKTNKAALLAADFSAMDKEIVTVNYVLSYKDNVMDVFKVLDQMENESHDSAAIAQNPN